jgi:hypothetical protein
MWSLLRTQNVNGSVASTDLAAPSKWKRFRAALPGSQSDSTFKKGLDKLIIYLDSSVQSCGCAVELRGYILVDQMGVLSRPGRTNNRQSGLFTIFFWLHCPCDHHSSTCGSCSRTGKPREPRNVCVSLGALISSLDWGRYCWCFLRLFSA